jgi:hypothetical protein
MKYKEQLQHPKWQKKRLTILNRDKFTCQICGDKETQLHVHHKEYSGKAWEAKDEDLTTICKHCHKLTHAYNNVNEYTVNKSIDKEDRLVIFLLMRDDLLVSYILNENTGEVEFNGILPKAVLDKAINFYTGI